MLTPETAVEQAVKNATHFMKEGVKAIDAQFGEGYSKHNPILVASFMDAAAADMQASATAQAIAIPGRMTKNGPM